MMDALVHTCLAHGVRVLRGYYYPTAKNHMVETFYGQQGFQKYKEDTEGNTEWSFKLDENYQDKNRHIKILGGEK